MWTSVSCDGSVLDSVLDLKTGAGCSKSQVHLILDISLGCIHVSYIAQAIRTGGWFKLSGRHLQSSDKTLLPTVTGLLADPQLITVYAPSQGCSSERLWNKRIPTHQISSARAWLWPQYSSTSVSSFIKRRFGPTEASTFEPPIQARSVYETTQELSCPSMNTQTHRPRPKRRLLPCHSEPLLSLRTELT